MPVLTLNAGSSSLKFALFDGPRPLLRGQFERIDDDPAATATGPDGAELDPPKAEGTGHDAVLPPLLAWIARHTGPAPLRAVGHRIVHGGDRTGPALVDDALLAELDALSPLAPLHQPHNLAAIRAVKAVTPALRQVACFDTAFHRTLPPLARRLALPTRLGLRRYGFHGLSYEWIAGQLPPDLAAGRVVVAHLGSGASLCALHAGQSVETTMSATPLDGLVMATRCGSLDPGLVLHLARQHGIDAAEHLLYHQAGLLGLSGRSGDMRQLDAHDPAVELFCYRTALEIAAMATALGGLDGLVFTGGIGEHDARIRAAIAARLAWLGMDLDPAAPTPGPIARPTSRVPTWVIPTDEEAIIARQTAALADAAS